MHEEVRVYLRMCTHVRVVMMRTVLDSREPRATCFRGRRNALRSPARRVGETSESLIDCELVEQRELKELRAMLPCA